MKTIAARILDQQKIPYRLEEYEWSEEELDAVTVARKVGLPPEQVFKTLVVRGDKTGVLVACIPANQELDLKALAAASGNKKVEMVPVKEIQGLTGYIRGGVSPLGMKKQYPFLSILKTTCRFDWSAFGSCELVFPTQGGAFTAPPLTYVAAIPAGVRFP